MTHRSDRIKEELDTVNYRELSDIGIEALSLMPLPQLLQVIDAVRADMPAPHRAKFDRHFMRELAE